jgi:hypothetical protein
METCRKCEGPLRPDSRFCGKCGRYNQENPMNETLRKFLVWLLAIGAAALLIGALRQLDDLHRIGLLVPVTLIVALFYFPHRALRKQVIWEAQFDTLESQERLRLIAQGMPKGRLGRFLDTHERLAGLCVWLGSLALLVWIWHFFGPFQIRLGFILP